MTNRWLVLTLASGANALAYADRQLLTLFMDPVRDAYNATDAGMGMLYGTSFSFVYALAGLMLLKWPPRTSGEKLAALAILAWTLLTITSSLIASFAFLILLRMGIGVAEAALIPAAMQLITDRFGKDGLGWAFAIFASGNYWGNSASLFLGGGLSRFTHSADHGSFAAFKLTLVALGLPGIFLAILFWMMPSAFEPRGCSPSLKFNAFAIAPHRNARFIWVAGAFGLMSFAGSQANAWIPTLLSRIHSWPTDIIGVAHGAATLVGGVFGTAVTGILMARSRRVNRQTNLDVWALGAVIAMIPISIAYPLVTSVAALLVLDISILILGAMSATLGYTIQAGLVSSDNRAAASATYTYIVAMIGPGLGPAAAPLVTKLLYGRDVLERVTLAGTGGIALVGAALALTFLRSAAPTRQGNRRIGRHQGQ